jgi:hypothetical protein
MEPPLWTIPDEAPEINLNILSSPTIAHSSGWKALLRHIVTSARLKSSFQNVLVNIGSQSLTMEHGNPWRWMMLLKKA